MREVTPGDAIFSFRDRRICAIGVAHSDSYECPKPPEFGAAGPNWDKIGWKVDVQFHKLGNPVRPKDHMDRIRQVLPPEYSPLRNDGNGLQNVYLTEIGSAFAEVLVGLIGSEARHLVSVAAALSADRPMLEKADRQGVDEWEDHLQQKIVKDSNLDVTEVRDLVKARRGQGLFKQRLMRVEKACRITHVSNPVHLMGSHIKPWRDSNNEERLDGENGLLLTPSIDHLFDRGSISFKNDGALIIAPRADLRALGEMGVPTTETFNVGRFTAKQKQFLEFHRDAVFLRAVS